MSPPQVLVHRIEARRDVQYTGPRGQTHGDTKLLRDYCMHPNEDRDIPELGLWLQAGGYGGGIYLKMIHMHIVVMVVLVLSGWGGVVVVGWWWAVG